MIMNATILVLLFFYAVLTTVSGYGITTTFNPQQASRNGFSGLPPTSSAIATTTSVDPLPFAGGSECVTSPEFRTTFISSGIAASYSVGSVYLGNVECFSGATCRVILAVDPPVSEDPVMCLAALTTNLTNFTTQPTGRVFVTDNECITFLLSNQAAQVAGGEVNQGIVAECAGGCRVAFCNATGAFLGVYAV